MLYQLELHSHLGGEDEDAELVAASEWCIDVFITEVKYNKSTESCFVMPQVSRV
jgi:hypothetical protein